MGQNLLPFDWTETKRYGISFMTIRLILLKFVQSFSFKKSRGVIFISDFSRKAVMKIIGPINGLTQVIHHGLDNRFFTFASRKYRLVNLSPERLIKLIYVSAIEPYKHQWNVVEAVSKILSPKHAVLGIAERVAVGIGFTVINTESVAVQSAEVNVHI